MGPVFAPFFGNRDTYQKYQYVRILVYIERALEAGKKRRFQMGLQTTLTKNTQILFGDHVI